MVIDSLKTAADALVIPTTDAIVYKTTEDDAEACTLAQLGTSQTGLIMSIKLESDGDGDATITPVRGAGWTSVVLADEGDHISLIYPDPGLGWVILGTSGPSGTSPVINY